MKPRRKSKLDVDEGQLDATTKKWENGQKKLQQ